ncbi:hypothetical protein [Caminibacter mediatlanticus]|uniref:Leucyl aminopeptidase n=1 Tax=Caminibacter mediatlanticus TB-2 TaxID=391592 RepID=A0AAI9F2T3_9BACT|nr:hypothetical protein [Caminibacter mediatlanticus]EDM24139.1 leucyl aminopeptidase [Caminibacter mediatlanticus TB-2]
MIYTIKIPWSGTIKTFEVDTKIYDIEIELITDVRLQNSKSPVFIEMVQKTKAIADGRIGFKNGVEGNINELNEMIKNNKEIFDNDKLAFYVISC